MSFESVAIALPIRDRATSHTFFREVFGIAPHGEPASDGIPEPLEFRLNRGLRVVLVPVDGFKWVLGDRAVAAGGVSECIMRLDRDSTTEVAELIDRARRAGATVTREPEQQPWAYEGAFTDPDGHLWLVAGPAPAANTA
jgi:predicted lactoylglutathione lyase